ncbi:MAG: DUF721 domain-containing protein [Pyrinomonadaceae bacterium]
MIDVTRLLPNIVRANPELAVRVAWGRAAGEGLRRNTNPFGFEGKTLTISVADALWQKQLQSMSSELIFRINKLLGRGIVNEIVFRIAPSEVSPAPVNCSEAGEKPKDRPLPTELMFAAGSIVDEELRARFLRAANNLIARRDSDPSRD